MHSILRCPAGKTFTWLRLFPLYYGFAEDDGGGSDAGTASGGDQQKTPASDGTINSVEDIPPKLYQQIFNLGVNKGLSKTDNKIKQKLIDMGVTDEKLEHWKKLEAEEERAEEDKLKAKGEFEKIKAKLVEGHQKDLEALRQENESLFGELKSVLIGKQIIAAAAKDDAHRPDELEVLLSPRFKLDRTDAGKFRVVALDVQGDPDVDNDGNPKSVEAVVREFLESNPHHVKSKLRGPGSGAPTGISHGPNGRGKSGRSQMTTHQKLVAALNRKDQHGGAAKPNLDLE